MNNIPWIEKYRPENFENIVLDEYNKILLNNIVEMDHFPNILFYGPPGTGKTTTIINLINKYQEKYNQKNKDLMIHLNASDERGIDIIRNQISQFVNSKCLFNKGLKFVILDEVDYMTKNAQQALKYLLQNYPENVRFCLICNYISRIDESLQNEFMRCRFNKLPNDEVTKFINKIIKNENMNINNESIKKIIQNFNNDLRSIINYLQCNQNNIDNFKLIDNTFWMNFTEVLKNKDIVEVKQYLQDISLEYHYEQKMILKEYINYLILKKELISSDFFLFVENAYHNLDINTSAYCNYIVLKLKNYLNEL
jgi:replication factor C subunit 3/5